MRSDAALSILTEEQQADLFDWLTTETYDVVLKRIAQPPPYGFGIKTHLNSLYRFYEQRQAAIRAHDLHRLNSIKWEDEAPDEPLLRPLLPLSPQLSTQYSLRRDDPIKPNHRRRRFGIGPHLSFSLEPQDAGPAPLHKIL